MTATPRPATHPFTSALVVGATEGLARIDREFLKQARIRHLRTASSGAEAFTILGREPMELVMCDARLADMTGQEFVAALRNDPVLRRLPVIMTATMPARSDVLRAVSLGAAGFLIRPYSQRAFSHHLAMARHMTAFRTAEQAAILRAKQAEAVGDVETAAKTLTAVVEEPNTAPRLFEDGMAALAAKDLDRAILLFHQALERNALYVEAHFGLARAWLAKGSVHKYRHCMKQAALACARTRRFEELRDRFVELLARDEAGFNPFLALGNELLADRRYTAAVAVLRHAQSLAPKNTDINLGLAKAYHFLRQPDLAQRALDKALVQNDRNPEAQVMYHRLTGRRYGDIDMREDASEEQPGGPPYPWLLRGVLYLAGWATDTLLRSRRPARAA